ncbi:MAG: hypothetical protein L0G46_11500, partial [Kocuria sp.]|nr:hypothetical protein [Kocuria sp.]
AWCCAKDPEARPQDADALQGELEHLLQRFSEEALDRRPPGYRDDASDLFSGLETASHTNAMQLAPFAHGGPPGSSQSVHEAPSATQKDGARTAEDADEPSGPDTTSVHARRSLDDATRVLPEGAVADESAERSSAHAAGSVASGSEPSAHQDPAVPTHVLGSTEPYRAWVWLLIFVLAACMVAYLGWLAGVTFLAQGSADPSVGAATFAVQAPPA